MVADALKTLGFTDDNAAITPLYTGIRLRILCRCAVHRIRVISSCSYKAPMQTIQMSALESDVDVAVIQEETFCRSIGRILYIQ